MPKRRKQPDRVRRSLLDCAARLAAEHGPGGVTVQAVAAAAGVTKGGLFHHFPSKEALLESLFSDLIARLNREIDGLMQTDPLAHGRFTRAYIRAVFADRIQPEGSLWAPLSVAMIADPALRRLWADWLQARLTRHADTDAAPRLEMARLAADGLWLSDLMEVDGKVPPAKQGLLEMLVDATKTER
ncbi:TetR/AcrR family transcriptional regulator [Mesorhizobium xinjiangense]|uniref:TetR/AcrR family transcriptional regulator n=1 Tax=Mesorhizobium xinjiangense TaxID=2678685 RepID=UPI001F3A9D3E|nr:TetR/AcrR family transcriptional regulator [Mesorhizobium xinjiangense]